jgi:peptide/nickel transport system substrate-binding protein
MRRLTLGAAAVVVVALGLSACTSSSQPVTAASDGTTTYQTGTPTKEVSDVAWYTFYRPVLGLVAATFADYPELMVTANLCESVVRVEPDFSIAPGIADFTVNQDSTVFTYKIRSGATFWDGSPVTTDDVIFSIKANTTPPWGAQNASVDAQIKSINATAPDTVTITLKAPNVIFNNLLAGSAGKVYQKKQAEQAGDAWGSPQGGIMCSGPYKVGKWDPANSLQIVRNDSYWSDDFKPLAKKITFSWPQDPTTLTNAFKTGWNIPPSIIAPLQAASSAGQMYVGSADTGLQMYGLIVSDVKSGNLADVNIRQALSKSIDREAIADKVYNGAADPLAVLAPRGSFSYAEDTFVAAAAKSSVKLDLEGAKALIAQTGKPAPNLVLAFPAGDSLATVTATALKTNVEAAGFGMTLKPMPPAEYAQLFNPQSDARKGVDLFFTIYAPVVRDPLVYYDDLLSSTGVYNFNSYNNARLDSDLAVARAATDDQVRADAIVKAQDQFVRDLPLIPLAAPRVTVWEGSGITGAPTTFTYLNSPWGALIGGK